MIYRIAQSSFFSLMILQLHFQFAATVITKENRKYFKKYLVRPTLIDVFTCCKDLESYARSRPDLFNENQAPLADLQTLCTDVYSEAQNEIESALKCDRLRIQNNVSHRNVPRVLDLYVSMSIDMQSQVDSIAADLQSRYEKAISKNEIDPGVMIPWFCTNHNSDIYRYYADIAYKFYSRFYEYMDCYRDLSCEVKKPKIILWNEKCTNEDGPINTRQQDLTDYMHSVNVFIFRYYKQITEDKDFPTEWLTKIAKGLHKFAEYVKKSENTEDYYYYCHNMGKQMINSLKVIKKKRKDLLDRSKQSKDTIEAVNSDDDEGSQNEQVAGLSKDDQSISTDKKSISAKFQERMASWMQGYKKYKEDHKDNDDQLLINFDD